MRIDVIIPAFNESGSIGLVLRDIPQDLVREVIVVNNASTDDTAAVAASAGATVLSETKRGYGAACLKGIAHISQKAADQQPDIVVFLDGDYSDYPGEMRNIVKPIEDQEAEMVIGSRALGTKQKGSMMPQQIFGNWLATTLMRLFTGAKYSDLGPFRAIKWKSLMELKMQDQNYGWTVEMQIKAARKHMRFTEVPVSYRKRIGKSKVSGTITGSVKAGYKIIITIFRYI